MASIIIPSYQLQQQHVTFFFLFNRENNSSNNNKKVHDSIIIRAQRRSNISGDSFVLFSVPIVTKAVSSSSSPAVHFGCRSGWEQYALLDSLRLADADQHPVRLAQQ